MSLMDAKDKRIAELESLLKAALEEIERLKAEIAILKKTLRQLFQTALLRCR